MKVQELRQLLADADRKLMEKAFVESYKQFPKAKKEEIDFMIQEILKGEDVKKTEKDALPDFQALEGEITEFIENAYAQNYLVPNRSVPKSKRSKWRFLVKDYIKKLEKVPLESEYYDTAVKLLTDIYKLMCDSCNTYYFSSDDPFRSIGWSQPDLYALVAIKTFACGYSREKIAAMILLAATGGISREDLPVMQEAVLIRELKTADVKYMAIEEAKSFVAKCGEQLQKEKKYSHTEFYLRENINNLCDFILLLEISLSEPEEGVSYYFSKCQEKDKEIVLYKALWLVPWADGDDRLWLDIYRYGLKKKIQPRDSLKKEYQKRLESYETKRRNDTASMGSDQKRVF